MLINHQTLWTSSESEPAAESAAPESKEGESSAAAPEAEKAAE